MAICCWDLFIRAVYMTNVQIGVGDDKRDTRRNRTVEWACSYHIHSTVLLDDAAEAQTLYQALLWLVRVANAPTTSSPRTAIMAAKVNMLLVTPPVTGSSAGASAAGGTITESMT